jgi:hypothetical protein
MASSGGYGSVANNQSTTANGVRRSGDEEQPLLGGVPSKSWRDKMMVNVQRDWADIVLLACYIITGLLDSASISIWGSFVSMQTGKTINCYLA